jgi:hypothetical protein
MRVMLSTVVTDDPIIERLRSNHGISEDSARWLLARLRKSRALDIIDETGMPIALHDDDEADQIGEELVDGIAAISEQD